MLITRTRVWVKIENQNKLACNHNYECGPCGRTKVPFEATSGNHIQWVVMRRGCIALQIKIKWTCWNVRRLYKWLMKEHTKSWNPQRLLQAPAKSTRLMPASAPNHKYCQCHELVMIEYTSNHPFGIVTRRGSYKQCKSNLAQIETNVWTTSSSNLPETHRETHVYEYCNVQPNCHSGTSHNPIIIISTIVQAYGTTMPLHQQCERMMGDKPRACCRELGTAKCKEPLLSASSGQNIKH